MIRILRVSSHPSKKRHGVGLHPYKISDTSKFETFFVTSNLEEDVYLNSEKFKLFISNIKFYKRPVHAGLLKTIFFHIFRIFKLLMFSIFCINVARKHSVKVVHIHSPMYFCVAIWGKLSGKKTYITYHGTDYIRIKDSKIYRFLSRKFIDVGVCISPHMIEKMKLNHKQTVFIPNGVDSDEFYNKGKEREKVLLAVGSLKKEKSYESLIRAFKLVSKDFPKYQLHIAGEGDLKDELKSLALRESISEKITFCGNLNKSQLLEKYNTSEFFILSSISEGFPKVVLEAIFCGCKVIATDVGSVNTFLPKKYIIKDNSTNSLLSSIVKIFNEKKYHIDIKKLESEFNWANVIDKYAIVYGQNI